MTLISSVDLNANSESDFLQTRPYNSEEIKKKIIACFRLQSKRMVKTLGNSCYADRDV